MAHRTAARHQQGRWAAQPSAAWPQQAQRCRPLAASLLGLTEWLPAPFTLCLSNAYHYRRVTRGSRCFCSPEGVGYMAVTTQVLTAP